MRLLFISNLYPPASIGGYEEVCFDVAQGLSGLGHDVQILTGSYRAKEMHEHEPGIYRRLRYESDWFSGKHFPRANQLVRRLFLEWWNTRTVRRIIARFAPDLVVIWNGGNLGRAFLTGAERGTPLTVYVLEDYWLSPVLREQEEARPAPFARLAFRTLLRWLGTPIRPIRADHLIFCSQALEEQYEFAGLGRRFGTVIFNGARPDIFSRRPQRILRRASDEPCKLLFSGRVSPEKGVNTLVRALKQLRAVPGLERTTLTLLGDVSGEVYKRELRDLIAELDLEPAIIFTPHQPRARLGTVYQEHDALVFPSEWKEPFGLSLIEAMLAGLPVISTVEGGPAEIVRNGENGVVFRAGDPDDLTQKLEWVLTHASEAASIGRSASEYVSRQFSLERQVRSLESYFQLCTRSVRPAADAMATQLSVPEP